MMNRENRDAFLFGFFYLEAVSVDSVFYTGDTTMIKIPSDGPVSAGSFYFVKTTK